MGCIRPVGRLRRGHRTEWFGNWSDRDDRANVLCSKRYSMSGGPEGKKCKDCDREEGTRLAKERTLRCGTKKRNTDEDFKYFPNLPVEIQAQIWELAAIEPRVVVTAISAKTDGAVSLSPVPALLHTCHRSREIALEHYILSFAGPCDGPKINVEPRIYFNFERDGLYFPKAAPKHYVWKLANVISNEDRHKLRFAGVALSDDMTGHTTECLLSRIFGGINQVSLALESARLDIRREVQLFPLESKSLWAFQKDARRIFGDRLVPKELNTEEAMEACKRAAVDIYGNRDGGNSTSKKEIVYEKAKGVFFATAANW